MKYLLIGIFAYYIIKRFGKLLTAVKKDEEINEPRQQRTFRQDHTDDEGFTEYEEVE